MMETQFTGGELVKQRVRIKAGVMGYLPHPLGSAFELSESCLSLRNLVVPCRVGLFSCGPGGAFLLDCSKLGGLTVDSTLEAGLKDVDLLSLRLGIERELGIVLQRKLFGAEELSLGGGIGNVRGDRFRSFISGPLL